MLAKGDTLIAGGKFNHVGKHTGGGALFTVSSDQPVLNFPKILGNVYSSTPDGNGGFYIYVDFKTVSEVTVFTLRRIEHVLADNSFDPNFSILVNVLFGPATILFHNGILYFSGEYVSQVAGQIAGNFSAIDVATKTLLPWVPVVATGESISKMHIAGNTMYVIGNFTTIGSVPRRGAAAIEIGTGVVKPWNPTPSFVSFIGYSSLLLYDNKIILGGSFNDGQALNNSQHACAIVDTTTGSSFQYVFRSGGLFGNAASYLHWGAAVKALAIKNDTLFAFSIGTFDTRITAINLTDSNRTIWTKYFNSEANAAAMVISGNSLFVAGSSFNDIYISNAVNDNPANIERPIKNAVKISTSDAALQSWFPDPVGWNVSDVYCLSLAGSNVFAGGNFSHVNRVDRTDVYMMNTQTETILPFKLDSVYTYPATVVNALKLVADTLYIGGNIKKTDGTDIPVAAYKINNNTAINWRSAFLGEVFSLEADEQYLFAGGRLLKQGSVSDTINLVAINRQTATLLNWAPNPDGYIYALHLTKDNLYAGGGFASIAGQSRNNIVAFNRSNLSITNWDPNANYTVASITSKDFTTWVGGIFWQLGDSSRIGYAGLQPVTGKVRPSFQLSTGTVSSIVSKGCYLVLGGSFRSNFSGNCNNLLLYNLFDKTVFPATSFC